MDSFKLLKDIVKGERHKVKDVGYSRFFTQRAISNDKSTFYVAYIINQATKIDDQLHYNLCRVLLNKNPYGKWPKKEEPDENIKLLMEAYDISEREAECTMSIMTEEKLKNIKEFVDNREGGLVK